MDKAELLTAWQGLGSKLLMLGVSMSEQADPGPDNGEEHAVKLWAIALLCRSINNFAGVKLLLGDALIVEARTLVRCCYENAFRMGYLVAKGHDAVKAWYLDHDEHNKKVGRDLLQLGGSQGQPADVMDEFEVFMKELNERESRKSGFAMQAEAGQTIIPQRRSFS